MNTLLADAESETVAASSPRSVLRLLGLLEVLARNADGSSLAQLCLETASPKSSLLLLLRPLTAEGYLLKSSQRYFLAPATFRLLSQLLGGRWFPRQMRPFLLDLARRTDETVYLATLQAASKSAIFLDMIAGANSVGFAMPVGFLRPLYTTAAGRLLLAYQDQTWQENYLATAKLEKLTKHTTTDVAEIRRELVGIRKLGMSISIDEAVDGGGAIAAPIYGPENMVEAALVVTAPTSRLRARLPIFQDALLDVAAKASKHRAKA